MRDRQAGFTLIEVLVVMVIFTIIIIAASQSFVPLLSQTKQQSKIAVSNIEGMLGIEVMRRDIAHAGYGLYWSLDPKSAPTASPTYAEVTAAGDANGAVLSDLPNGIPRAIAIGGGRGLNGSDWLAVKAVNVAANQLSERWAYLYASPTVAVSSSIPASENVGAGEYVIVVRPDQTERYLMFTAGVSKNFYSQFSNVAASYDPGTTSLVFSLGTTTVPKMPFNRADYVVQNSNVPARCAAGTGVLFKRVVNQAVGSTGYLTALPLLDCVADMQVAYRFDSNADGYADAVADATADQPLTALDARKIREVRVYILAQEGAVDRNFTYSAPIAPSSIRVGETGGAYGSFGRDFNLTAITNWQNYRWKLYTLMIEPICLLDWTVTP